MQLLSVIALLFIFNYSMAQTSAQQTDIYKNNLKGAVKSITETSYSKNGTPAVNTLDSSFQKEETKYNRAGFITQFSRTSSVLTNQGQTFLDQTYIYNADNVVIARINVGDYGLTHTDTFTYDAQGNILNETSYNNRHQPVSKITYLYDEKGRVLLLSSFTCDSARYNLVFETAITYFDMEHQRETKTHLATGEFDDVLTSFDQNGRAARSQRLDKFRNTINEWDWTYDKSGNTIRYEERSDFTAKDVKHYTYTFDKTGNWIEQVISDSHNKSATIIKRQITYYQ